MAEDQILLSDEELTQELLSFGETVVKITDKNRQILEKKLNHLRARRRMSEKLSQSMVAPKSPMKATRGRGKRNNKFDVKSTHSYEVHDNSVLKDEVAVPSDAINQSKGASLSVTDNVPPQKKVKKSGRSNEEQEAYAVDLTTALANKPVPLLSAESEPSAPKRGRRSAMPSIGVTMDKKVASDVATKTLTEEKLHQPAVGSRGRAVGRNKKGQAATSRNENADPPTSAASTAVETSGQITNRPIDNTEPMDLTQYHEDDVDAEIAPARDVGQLIRRRTYSCEKPESDVSKINKDPQTGSRIPKYSRGKAASQHVGTSPGIVKTSESNSPHPKAGQQQPHTSAVLVNKSVSRVCHQITVSVADTWHILKKNI
jgi:LEM domain